MSFSRRKREEHWVWSQGMKVGGLALLLTGYVTSSKSFTLSVPWFPHLSKEVDESFEFDRKAFLFMTYYVN